MMDEAVSTEAGSEAPCFAHLLEQSDVTDPMSVGALRGLADAVVIANSGTIVVWNDSTARLFGWSASEAPEDTTSLS